MFCVAVITTITVSDAVGVAVVAPVGFVAVVVVVAAAAVVVVIVVVVAKTQIILK